LASLRLGMAFCHPKIVDVLNLIKPPYNISGPVQNHVLKALKHEDQMRLFVEDIKELKKELGLALEQLPIVLKVYPSEANFFLVKFKEVQEVFQYLIRNEIILRNRSGLVLCEDCIRITVGTAFENKQLILALNNYLKI
jgi:histidinol-phosphate aminotransferase